MALDAQHRAPVKERRLEYKARGTAAQGTSACSFSSAGHLGLTPSRSISFLDEYALYGLLHASFKHSQESTPPSSRNSITMYANFANILSLVVLATSFAPALAAPILPNTEKRAVGAIVGGLVRGAATGALEAGFDDVKNDLGLRRSIPDNLLGHVGTLPLGPGPVILDNANERRAVGAIVGGLVRGAATGALEAGFDDVKNDLGLRRRAYDSIPSNLLGHLGPGPVILDNDNEKRAVGAILGGLARGGAEGAVESLLGDDNQRRAIGPILSGIASGVGRVAAEDIFGDNDDSDNQRRAVGAILGGLARGGAEGVVESLLDNDNQRRAIGPILSGIASGVGRTAVEDIFGDNDNERRAILPIPIGSILLPSGVTSSFSDGKERREVINIPRKVLLSLAARSVDELD
ncbi:hypothetical protein PENSPDRAFT_350365 [Peniophora sp. CONT]|nr:hypothetical protein PENSPDRAFT_350365 [Peniophora sp. CONT]